MRLAAVAAVALVFVPALAQADTERIATRVATATIDGPPGSDLDAPPPYAVAPLPAPVVTADEAPAPIPTAIDHRAVAPGAQRGLITSTALTTPEGTAELSLRMLAPIAGLVGMSGGITRTTEIWADAGKAMTFDDDEALGTYGAGIKQVLGGGDTWQAAATASARSVSEGDDRESAYALGGVLSTCASARCSVLFSAGLTGVWIDDENVVLYQLGFSAGSRNARFLVDAVGNREATIVTVGARFGGAKLAAEIGLAAAVADHETELAPLPLVSVMSRM